ncbi:MAG: hypothetical protein PHV16_01875 [Candidatus Nanoarchaeia archaeon]|nr:hypothetical protein [Candidatus Nanoarchaeia archaeon]
MNKTRFAVLTGFFVLLTPLLISADLQLKPLIEKELEIGKTYKNLFMVENTDYSSDEKSCIDAFVYYNISGKELFHEDNFNVKCMNKYKSSGTGAFTPEKPGKYLLCGLILNSTAEYRNNASCTEIFVKAIPKRSFNISINVNVVNQDTFKVKEKDETTDSRQANSDSPGQPITGKTVYESSSIKSVNVSRYIFIGILVLFVALLLLKK